MLPKSFKTLTKKERATLYTEIESHAKALESGAAKGNLFFVNTALDAIQKRTKVLERAGVAQAIFDAIPKDFTTTLKRKKVYKFGITFCPAVPHRGVKEGDKLFLLANGVKCAIDFKDIETVW